MPSTDQITEVTPHIVRTYFWRKNPGSKGHFYGPWVMNACDSVNVMILLSWWLFLWNIYLLAWTISELPSSTSTMYISDIR